MFGTIIWFLIGAVLFVVIWRVGIGMLSSMTSPLPPPPPPGEMRRINVLYRCGVCGVELRVVMAPDQAGARKASVPYWYVEMSHDN